MTEGYYVPAEFGGLAGADSICNAEAADAGLPGSYIAWLSDSDDDAIDRLTATGARGWIRPDGFPVADDPGQFANKAIWYPMRVEADGDLAPTNASPITGTGASGTAVVSHCDDFTADNGTVAWGYASGVLDMWTYRGAKGCGSATLLYCLGVSKSAPLDLVVPSVHWNVFLSESTFTPDAGLAAFDAACNGDATEAGLPGSYAAMVATVGASALDRADLSRPWVLPNGATVVQDPQTLTSRSDVDVGIGLFADGGTYFAGSSRKAMIGADDIATAGDATTTCANWESTVGTLEQGIPGYASHWWADNGTNACDNFWAEGHVYCVQVAD